MYSAGNRVGRVGNDMQGNGHRLDMNPGCLHKGVSRGEWLRPLGQHILVIFLVVYCVRCFWVSFCYF